MLTNTPVSPMIPTVYKNFLLSFWGELFSFLGLFSFGSFSEKRFFHRFCNGMAGDANIEGTSKQASVQSRLLSGQELKSKTQQGRAGQEKGDTCLGSHASASTLYATNYS